MEVTTSGRPPKITREWFRTRYGQNFPDLLAEDKNDLVAVRDILKIKRDLERQRHRLLYNKNTLFKGKKGYKRPSSIKVKDEKDDD